MTKSNQILDKFKNTSTTDDDNYDNHHDKVLQTALQALHTATIAALPAKKHYGNTCDIVCGCMYAHANDVIDEMRKKINELYGVKQ